MSAKHFFSLPILLLLATFLAAQKGMVHGVVVEQSNNETLPGATVSVLGYMIGTSTNLDGQYELRNLELGEYRILCTYVSFKTDTLTVKVTAGGSAEANFSLRTSEAALQTVVVTAKIQKSSVGSLVALTRKTPSVISGIAQEDIRRSPDRSTKDVLKRISAASIQENKFLIVRGLADRYNMPMLNGSPVPSTETDRRAFAFDLLPSALVDNIVIYKTASPDLPGEFAGGVVNVSTKDIAEKPFLQISLGTGFNTLTTGKAYRFHQTGGTDWLGVDDGTRALPKDLPNTATYQLQQDDPAKRFEQSKLFKNDWALQDHAAMSVTLNFQLAGATNFDLGEQRKLGLIAGLTWSRTPNIFGQVREDYSGIVGNLNREYHYDDRVTSFTTLWGGLANMAYQISPKHRLIFNNTFSVNALDRLIEREGPSTVFERDDRATSDYFSSNQLFTSQLRGEHRFGDVKLDWNGAINHITRDAPAYRQMFYYRPLGDSTAAFSAYVTPNSPSPNYGGRIYSKQIEDLYTVGVDAVIPPIKTPVDPDVEPTTKVRVGAQFTANNRTFDNRYFGYVYNSLDFDQRLLSLSQGDIFSPENVHPNAFFVKEATRGNDAYTASSKTLAGYFRADYIIGDFIHVSGGARAEWYNQHLESQDAGGGGVTNIDTAFLDFLPSANIYFPFDESEKHRLRFSGSRTVSRPNFRELAPYVFWDFDLQAGIYGEPKLQPTRITNVDVRYEFFPGKNQFLFVGGFYKAFDQPVEVFSDGGGGSRRFGFVNAKSAECLGVELEYRYKPIENLTLFGNVALINSEVGFTVKQKKAGFQPRPLQGQSPYVLNFGVTYSTPGDRVSATVLFNQIGRRIWLVAQNTNYPDTYEAPRGVLDFTLTFKVDKHLDAKLTASDLLRPHAIFYLDSDGSGKYEAGTDGLIRDIQYPTVFGLSLNYTISK